MQKCRSCGAPVIWATTEDGRKVPLDPKLIPLAFDQMQNGVATGTVVFRSGRQVHFATCPNADQHRKPREAAPQKKSAPRAKRHVGHTRCAKCGKGFYRGAPGSRFVSGKDYCSEPCVPRQRRKREGTET